jgi:hypothetical protein
MQQRRRECFDVKPVFTHNLYLVKRAVAEGFEVDLGGELADYDDDSPTSSDHDDSPRAGLISGKSSNRQDDCEFVQIQEGGVSVESIQLQHLNNPVTPLVYPYTQKISPSIPYASASREVSPIRAEPYRRNRSPEPREDDGQV